MEGNSIKSFENLCKIFEMRIKLDKEILRLQVM